MSNMQLPQITPDPYPLNAAKTEKLMQDLPIAARVAGAAIKHHTGGSIDPLTSRDPDSSVNEEQHELLSDVREIFEQVRMQGGVIPATMLYMHPMGISYSPGSSGPHNEGISIPACPIQDEYVSYVHRSFRRDFGDRWGRFKVRPVWPIQIVQDIAQQHRSWFGEDRDWGGIVVYMGDFLPGQQRKQQRTATEAALNEVLKKVSDPEAKRLVEIALAEQSEHAGISEEKVVEMIRVAQEKQITAYQNRFEICNGFANDKSNNGFRAITKVDRLIASWLHHRKFYSKMPDWVTQKRALGTTAPIPCPRCGTDLPEKGYACGNVGCGRVHKPFEAFQDGAIKADDPAMKRCTREQLDFVGLKSVQTLEEERMELQTKPADDEKEEGGKKGKGK